MSKIENVSSLEELRRQIDRLDAELVARLNRRAAVVRRIGELKHSRSRDVYVPARERQVLRHVSECNHGPLPDQALRAIYREIMSASLALEKNLCVAYLGPEATFTHQAARGRFGASVRYAPCETVSDVFAMVCNRKADYGVVPVENSIEGAVAHTLDEFAATPLKIYAEIYLPIAHHLMAKRGARRALRRIYSHPQVFGQCRNWLRAQLPGVEQVPLSSTARAAETAAGEPGAGALASALAAELYGLKIMARDIQDLGGNVTRFLVLGHSFGRATGADKTSLLFTVKHRVGALHRVLETFKQCAINMSKIESRPSRLKAWEYLFFVDIEGHAGERRVKQALAEMERHCTTCTVLGSYPRAGADV